MPQITHPDLLDLGRRLAAPTPAERDVGLPAAVLPGGIGGELMAELIAGAVVNLLGGCRKSGRELKALAVRARDHRVRGWPTREKIRAAIENALEGRPALAEEESPEWYALRDWVVARFLEAGASDSVSAYDVERAVKAATDQARAFDGGESVA